MDFSKLGETLSEAGRDVSKKAKDLTENIKMDMDIRSKESYINKQYASLGKKYFEMHENDDELLFEEIRLIREAKGEIQRMRDLMAEKKGWKKCQACQAVMAQDAQFCPQCGTKYEMPVAEEVVQDAEEIQAEEVSVEEVQAQEMSGEAVEPEETSAGEVQAEGVSAGEVQAEEVSAEEVQAEEVSAGEVQAEEASAGEVQVEEEPDKEV